MIVGHDPENNLPVTLIPRGTHHRGKLWMHNGYSYIKNSEYKGNIYLVCRMGTVCKAHARLKTHEKVFLISSKHTCHD